MFKLNLYLYCIKLNKKILASLIISGIIIIISIIIWIIDLYSTTQLNALGTVCSIGSLGLVINDIIQLKKGLSDSTGLSNIKSVYMKSENTELIVNPPKNSDFTFTEKNFENGTIFYSNELNMFLCKNKKISAEISNIKYKRIRKNLYKNSNNYLPFLAYKTNECKNHDEVFKNDLKLCMTSDIYKNKSVLLHIGGYFDTYLTNIVCNKALFNNSDNCKKYNAIEYPINLHDNSLKSIDDSEMNDEIGVSTVAFTNDHRMILFTQNRCVASDSAGLFAPSGSGSSDADDYCENDLYRSITNGMNRELLEETCLEKKKLHENNDYKTKIIGYFRWKEKGGKPEFVGITKLINTSHIDIESQETEVCDLNCTYTIESEEDLKKCIDALLENKNTSVPLVATLFFIKEYIDNGNFNMIKKYII